MNRKRFELCKKYIEDGGWIIDLDKGIVTGKKGSTGCVDATGYLILGIGYEGVVVNFGVHEIIAVAGGLIPIDTTIDHINGDKLDNRLCNLQLLSNVDNVKKAFSSAKILCIETGAIWNNSLEIEESLGIYHGSVSRCCRGIRHTAGGYHWRYVTETLNLHNI